MREKGRSEKANEGKKDSDAEIAKLNAELAALSNRDPKDPRLSHRGRLPAKALTADAPKLVEIDVRKTEMEAKARARAVRISEELRTELDHTKDLQNKANECARTTEAELSRQGADGKKYDKWPMEKLPSHLRFCELAESRI